MQDKAQEGMARLEAIRARAEAATEGPWYAEGRNAGASLRLPKGSVPVAYVDDDYGRYYVYVIAPLPDPKPGNVRADWASDVRLPSITEIHANKEFIAHARTDVPYLLTLLDTRQQKIERLRGLLAELTDAGDAMLFELIEAEAVCNLTIVNLEKAVEKGKALAEQAPHGVQEQGAEE